MGGAHRPRPAGRGATGCEQSRFRAGARGRPRAPDGRHDNARRGLGAARWAGAASARSLLAAHARIPANRPRDMAEDSCRTRRERYVCEALRPAAATDAWKRLAGGDVPWIEGALQGLTVIEAANAEEEALAIAISLREAIETPAKTAALVTPDRALARRVLAALERWNVAVEDSAGEELADTPAGLFARLAAEAALDGVTPVALLALLKHPLLRLGAAAGAHARAIAVLEKAVLRGPRPRPGTAGLAHALTVFHTEFAKLQRGPPSDLHPSDPRADLTDAQPPQAAALLARLAPAPPPLQAQAPAPLPTIAAPHPTA